MYLISTILLGWFILSFLFQILEAILNVEPGLIFDCASAYIFIGYLVMAIYNIKSPLMISENPLLNIKKIELKLFFKDIYYAIWWPYYIFRNLK